MKRLLLVVAMIALFACALAVTVSAAEIPEWTEITELDGMADKATFGADGTKGATSRVLMSDGVTYPAFCDFMEYLTDRVMIPVCALGTCIFVGWVWKPENAIAEMEQCGVRFGLAKAYSILIKYIAPVAILAILIMSLTAGMTLS